MLADTWFNGWERAGTVALSALATYAGLVVLLRIGGKRTLSRFSVFDWVVTVAFGTMMGTTIVSNLVSVVDGIVAFATLVVIQAVVAFASTRSDRAERLLTGRPTLLAHRGTLLRDAMRRERVSEAEISQALRSHSAGSLDDVTAIVLETNGNLSILTDVAPDAPSLDRPDR